MLAADRIDLAVHRNGAEVIAWCGKRGGGHPAGRCLIEVKYPMIARVGVPVGHGTTDVMELSAEPDKAAASPCGRQAGTGCPGIGADIVLPDVGHRRTSIGASEATGDPHKSVAI